MICAPVTWNRPAKGIHIDKLTIMISLSPLLMVSVVLRLLLALILVLLPLLSIVLYV